MSDNKCAACGQFAGRGHKCPTTVPTTPAASFDTALNRNEELSALREHVDERVAAAWRALESDLEPGKVTNTTLEESLEPEWDDKNGHGPKFEPMITAEEIDAEATNSYGDYAVGKGYETVLRRRLPDGNYETLTYAYYVEAVQTTNQPVVRDSHVVNERIEAIVHSDPDDMGGTEIRNEIDYSEGSAYFYDDPKEAEKVAKRLAHNITADDLNSAYGL